jgi:tetratricopeptide (TPR) repeat protein
VENRSNLKSDRTSGDSEQSRKGNRNLSNEAAPSVEKAKDDDDLEFVITEKNEDDREFVGGQKQFPDDDNKLGIEKTSDLMEKEALSVKGNGEQLPSSPSDFKPIGETSPPLPQEPASSSPLYAPTARAAVAQPSQETPAGQWERVKKLSPKEVESIEQSLYSGNSYLTDREKEELIKKMGKLDGPASHQSVTAPVKDDPTDSSPETKSDLPKPKMAKKGKGIAYFYKNYIQIIGSQELRAEDELYINNRCYELNPKQFNTKAMIGVGAVLFVLVLFLIGSQFVSTDSTREGEIIGMVLDEMGQPYVHGATIRLPDLGKSSSSTPQGFFRFGPVPEGSHKIEYTTGDKLLKVDYATVAGGKITMLSLRPDEVLVAEAATREARSKSQPPPSEADSRPVLSSPKEAAHKSTSKKTTPKSTILSAKKSSKKDPAKITLAANVQGARFAVDDDVLGAGNLTYSKIKPGEHKYTVSKNGYQPVSGTINLAPGEDKTLSVDLVPINQSAKAEVFSEEDFYHSGLAALEEGNFETAISDLTDAISKSPSYAEAYLARAEAYTITREKKLAYDDYIRAAEILQIKKDFNQAITAYNNAVDLDEKSTTAYLGRANAYLAKNEEIAAIADYKAVLKLDKRNARGYFGLGEARFKQGRYKKACEHFKDARSLDSENPLIYQYLMLCYLAMDDIKKVKKSFEKFRNVASEEQIDRLRADSKFSAVLRIVDND